MLSNQEHIDEWIAAFLSGEATREEQEQLLQWIGSSAEHQAYFEQVRDAWVSSSQANSLPSEKIEQALQQTKAKALSMSENSPQHLSSTVSLPTSGRAGVGLSVTEKRVQSRKAQKSIWPRGWFKYAAAVVLLLASAYGVTQHSMNRWFERQSSEMVYEAHYGSRGYTVLPDNSVVWLNSGSKLSFRSDYNFRERTVQLTGEAYFEVQTNPDKPFVVKTGKLDVVATGTKFNVKAYPEEDRIVTTLVEGIVTLEGKDDQQKEFALKMQPNQSVSFYKQQASFEEVLQKAVVADAKPAENAVENKPVQAIPATLKEVRTEVYTSWKSDRWIIDREPFGSLAIELERRYNVNILFDSDELKKYHFTGTIERETLEQMFNVFRYSIPLQYKIEKGIVTLTLDEQLKKRYEKAWK